MSATSGDSMTDTVSTLWNSIRINPEASGTYTRHSTNKQRKCITSVFCMLLLCRNSVFCVFGHWAQCPPSAACCVWRPFVPLRCDTPLHDCIKLLCIVDSSRTWGGFPFFDAEKWGCRKPRDACSLCLVGLPTTSPRVLLSLQLRFPALTFQWNKHIHETVGVQNPRMFLWLTRPPPSCVVVWPVSVRKTVWNDMPTLTSCC